MRTLPVSRLPGHRERPSSSVSFLSCLACRGWLTDRYPHRLLLHLHHLGRMLPLCSLREHLSRSSPASLELTDMPSPRAYHLPLPRRGYLPSKSPQPDHPSPTRTINPLSRHHHPLHSHPGRTGPPRSDQVALLRPLSTRGARSRVTTKDDRPRSVTRIRPQLGGSSHTERWSVVR